MRERTSERAEARCPAKPSDSYVHASSRGGGSKMAQVLLPNAPVHRECFYTTSRKLFSSSSTPPASRLIASTSHSMGVPRVITSSAPACNAEA